MEHTVEYGLFQLSLGAYLVALTVVAVSGLIHIGSLAMSALSGRPAVPDRLHIFAVFGLAAGLVFVLAEYLLSTDPITEDALYFHPFNLPVVFAPIALLVPLIRIRQYYRITAVAYPAALVVVLAMPLIAISVLALAMRWSRDDGTSSIYLEPETRAETLCSAFTDRLRLREFSEAEVADPALWKVVDSQFWFNNTVQAAAFDLPEAFGCNISLLRHDQSQGVISATVAGYRMLIAGIAIILIYPVRRRWLSATRGASATLIITRSGVKRSNVVVRIQRVSDGKVVFAEMIAVGRHATAKLLPDREHIFTVEYTRMIFPPIIKEVRLKLGPESVNSIEFGVSAFLRMDEDVYISGVNEVKSFASSSLFADDLGQASASPLHTSASLS